MAGGTPVWQPGTQYAPGSIVTPRTNTAVISEQPANNSFEDGLTHWNVTGEFVSDGDAQAAAGITTAEAFDGSQSATVTPVAGDGTGPVTPSGRSVAVVVFTNDFMADVTPGQNISFKCRFWHIFVPDTNQVDPYGAGARIAWFDASNTFISYTYGNVITSGTPAPVSHNTPGLFAFPNDNWVTISGTGTAPAGAAFAAAAISISSTDYSSQGIYADDYTWDYTHQGFPEGLVFVATQADVGTSASVEPVWPGNGMSVTDNTVTWEGEFASQITWTASSILTSGDTEPDFPLNIGGAIADGTIAWVGTDGRITDPNCPQSKIVTIASAKVFAADNDIIRYSATANAQDWSASQDAGYIPFGLQAYGNEACKGLGLYRSNLVATNTLGYQMWQVDPDPNNIAILDAEPVGCGYHKSIQPVNNDLVFLSPVGLRNIGTAGAAGNLQAGQFGKQVDPLVKQLIKQITALGYEPRGLFSPGTGQYWLLIGKEAIALTINGASTMSWSRYSFPDTITDWTVSNGALFVRAADLVWELSEDALNDDEQVTTTEGGENIGFQGYMSWNYLDCGPIAIDKQMEGFDLVVGQIDNDGTVVSNDVEVNVTFGYNQSAPEQATDPYTITGDTIPGTMVPMPLTAASIQLRLDFGTGQNWGWSAANLYASVLAK